MPAGILSTLATGYAAAPSAGQPHRSMTGTAPRLRCRRKLAPAMDAAADEVLPAAAPQAAIQDRSLLLGNLEPDIARQPA